MTIFLKNPNQIENSTRISSQKVIRSLSLIAFTVRQRVEDAIGWKKYSIVGIQICVITSRIRRESISRRGIGTLGADNINELNFNRRSWRAEIYSNGIPAMENRFVHSFIYGWKEKHRDPLLRLIVTLFSSFALRDARRNIINSNDRCHLCWFVAPFDSTRIAEAICTRGHECRIITRIMVTRLVV